MAIWECQNCGYQYASDTTSDVALSAHGAVAVVLFDELPRSWRCPSCRASKLEFEPLEAIEDPDDPERQELWDNVDRQDDEYEAPEEDASLEQDIANYDEQLNEDYDEPSEADLHGEFVNDDVMPEDDDEEGLALNEGLFVPSVEDALEDPDDPIGWDDIDEPVEAEGYLQDALEDDPELAIASSEEYEETRVDDESALPESDAVDEDLRSYICADCNYVYDPAEGFVDSEAGTGIPFSDIMEEFFCPACGAGAEQFVPRAPTEPARLPTILIKNDRNPVLQPPDSIIASPRHLSLDDLLIRPQASLGAISDDDITLLTLLGIRCARPLHLTLPIMFTSVAMQSTVLRPFDAAALASRLGISCIVDNLLWKDALQTKGLLVLEIHPDETRPNVAQLEECCAVEVLLGWRGTRAAESMAVENRFRRTDSVTRGKLPSLVEVLRKSCRGPIGLRFPAGAIEADLELLLPSNPDYVVLECLGSRTLSWPAHVAENALLPTWMAAHRARRFLDERGFESVVLVIGGEISSVADIMRLLALGADVVQISDLGRMVSVAKNPGLLANTPAAALDALVLSFEALALQMRDFCALAGKNDIHDLNRSDLIAMSAEIAAALDLTFDRS